MLAMVVAYALLRAAFTHSRVDAQKELGILALFNKLPARTSALYSKKRFANAARSSQEPNRSGGFSRQEVLEIHWPGIGALLFLSAKSAARPATFVTTLHAGRHRRIASLPDL